MSPLLSWLALVAVCALLVWLVMRVDAHLWRRKYERDDETRQYQKARDAVARQQAADRTRLGHGDGKADQ